MKFNKTLEREVQQEWKAYAVNYKKLKMLLPSTSSDDQTYITSPENDSFWEIIGQSLRALQRFNDIKETQIKEKLKEAESHLERHRMKNIVNIKPNYSKSKSNSKTQSEDFPAGPPPPIPLPEFISDMFQFTNEIEALMEFYELNFTAFSKILKKYDKRTFSTFRQAELEKIQETHSFLNGDSLMDHKDKLGKLRTLASKLEEMESDGGNGGYSGGDGQRSKRSKEKLDSEMILKARVILDDLEKDSNFFANNVKRSNPSFHINEIQRGYILGEGEFGTVREVRKFKNVREICPICFLHGKFQQAPPEEDTDAEASVEPSIATTDEKRIVDFTPPVNDTYDNPSGRIDAQGEESSGLSFQSDHQEEDQEEVSKRGFMNHHCLREGSARYAIKQVKRSLVGLDRIEAAIDLGIEASVLSIISHPNIMRLRGIGGSIGHPDFFLVLDRLYGTLSDKFNYWKSQEDKYKKFMRRKKKSGDLEILWNDRLLASYDIAKALKYLHGHNLIYRDLKPENIGFDVRGNIKIFDFGLVKELREKDKVQTDQYKASGRTGTRRYMAPEVTLCKPYGKPADVYSFAILFWEIMALETPFSKYNTHEKFGKNVVQEKKRPSIPSSWSTFLKGLMKEGWAYNPSMRPDIDRICDLIFGEINDFFADIGENKSDRSKRLMKLSNHSMRLASS